MSRQLQARLDELEEERARVRSGIRRIGEAFASGLDRDALLQLALRTAMDATAAGRGRVLARRAGSEPLAEVDPSRPGLRTSRGRWTEAEQAALDGDGIGEASSAGVHVASVRLGNMTAGRPDPRADHGQPRRAARSPRTSSSCCARWPDGPPWRWPT